MKQFYFVLIQNIYSNKFDSEISSALTLINEEIILTNNSPTEFTTNDFYVDFDEELNIHEKYFSDRIEYTLIKQDGTRIKIATVLFIEAKR